jgi:aminopeptidase
MSPAPQISAYDKIPGTHSYTLQIYIYEGLLMSSTFERTLEKYADLIVRVGLNLQEGQRLVIHNSRHNGVSIKAAALIRNIVSSAYQNGARFVDILWGDEQVNRTRFECAPADSFEEYPVWQAKAVEEYLRNGDAVLTVLSEDPDLLAKLDPERIATAQRTTRKWLKPSNSLISQNASNWVVTAAASPAWAAKVFPGLSQETSLEKLWRAIFSTCRMDQPDPIEAWQKHNRNLQNWSRYLTDRAYTALRFTGPGTNLTVGMPSGHIWQGGSAVSENGIEFNPNLPTEEIFSMPHKDRVDGVVRATMPLNYGGTLIEDISLTFAGGRVVGLSASKGETLLRRLIETDEGAAHLGEVALVPHSSPISQSGILFYNTLFDENASSHLALGRAYNFNIQGGITMNEAEFAEAGGNLSLAHVDFMIGSDQIDVDGLTGSGTVEAIMRKGEWVF